MILSLNRVQFEGNIRFDRLSSIGKSFKAVGFAGRCYFIQEVDLFRDVCESSESIEVIANFIKIVVGCGVYVLFILLLTFHDLTLQNYGFLY